jgi:hypothetical protein
MPKLGVILPKLGVGEPSVWEADAQAWGRRAFRKAMFPEDITQRRRTFGSRGAEDAEKEQRAGSRVIIPRCGVFY